MFCKYDKGDLDLRPCLADGKPATFHRWAEWDEVHLHINIFASPEDQGRLYNDFHRTGYAPIGCSTEVQHQTFALVEYPDGSVGKVKPELIQFLDRKEG